MQKYNGTLLRKFDDPVQGNASVGTSVIVRKKSDNSIAPIYSVDDVNSIQKPNPFTTDAFGRYSFFAPNGKYILQFGDGSDEIEISMVDNLDHNSLSERNAAGAHDAIYSRGYATLADMLADAPYLSDGVKVNWRGYYSESDGGSNWGIVRKGNTSTVVDDGGSIFIAVAGASGTWIEANLNGKSVNIKKFGGKSGINNSPIIQKACDYLSTSGSYEKSASLYFPPDIYRLDTQILLNVNHGNMRWWSDGNASLDVRNLASEHPLIVDYSTGATANFLKFDMENIHWTDTSLSNSRRGPLFRRVIGSRFTNCHFNYLSLATGLDDDSNLNHFDSCQWRGNVTCLFGYTGVANNNTFTNCQWRYNSGTVLDCLGSVDYPATFENTMFIGGDFEPYNTGNPIIRANAITMKNVRFERNTNDQKNIEVHNLCTFDDMDFPSDGATQCFAFDVLGSDNILNIRSFSGSRAILFREGADNNQYSARRLIKMTSSAASIIADEGNGNIAIANGTAQTKGLSTRDEYIITPDLTTWAAFGCAVTYDAASKSYTIASDGTQPRAYIYSYFSGGIGGYKGQTMGLTAKPLNPSGQLVAQISDSLTNLGGINFSLVNSWKRHYVCAKNYEIDAPDNPYFMLELVGAVAGAACSVRDVAIGFTQSLPYL